MFDKRKIDFIFTLMCVPFIYIYIYIYTELICARYKSVEMREQNAWRWEIFLYGSLTLKVRVIKSSNVFKRFELQQNYSCNSRTWHYGKSRRGSFSDTQRCSQRYIKCWQILSQIENVQSARLKTKQIGQCGKGKMCPRCVLL